jgi:hypothetical protein
MDQRMPRCDSELKLKMICTATSCVTNLLPTPLSPGRVNPRESHNTCSRTIGDHINPRRTQDDSVLPIAQLHRTKGRRKDFAHNCTSASIPQESTTLPRSTIAWLLSSIRRISQCLLSLPNRILFLHLVLVLVVKRQLRACLDILNRKERNIIDSRVVLIIADGILAAIRFAGVIDEPRRTSHVLTVNDIAGSRRQLINIVDKLIQTVEIALLVFRAGLLTSISLFIRDDLAEIGVDELSLNQVFVTEDTPAAVCRFEDGEWNLASILDHSALADWAAFAVDVAFVDWVPFFSVELHQRLRLVMRLRRVLIFRSTVREPLWEIWESISKE